MRKSLVVFFFFSSRRRHTRLQGDWSSDVCSSDLVNRDGWPDIYVANDFFERDYLYINKGDGTFAERLEQERSEEHTSELQSPCNLVCRLLLEKKKNNTRFKPAQVHSSLTIHSRLT